MSRACEKQNALYLLKNRLIESGLTREDASSFVRAIAGTSMKSEIIRQITDVVSEVEKRNRNAEYNAGYERAKELAVRAIAELPAPGPNSPGNDRFRHSSSE